MAYKERHGIVILFVFFFCNRSEIPLEEKHWLQRLSRYVSRTQHCLSQFAVRDTTTPAIIAVPARLVATEAQGIDSFYFSILVVVYPQVDNLLRVSHTFK